MSVILKLTWINTAATAQIVFSCFFLYFRKLAGHCFDRIFHPECGKHLLLWCCQYRDFIPACPKPMDSHDAEL